jgi:hypothetical protein
VSCRNRLAVHLRQNGLDFVLQGADIAKGMLKKDLIELARALGKEYFDMRHNLRSRGLVQASTTETDFVCLGKNACSF